MQSTPPHWQLPPGVQPGMWDYLHDAAIARDYDANQAGSPLLSLDQQFIARECSQPCRVLDMGCGPGRSLIPLVRRGFQAVGVDLSEAMLAQAQLKASETGVALDLVKANIVALDGLANASFDRVLCMFSTLGMVAGAKHRQSVVAHAHRLLRPGGRFILHVHNRWNCLWDRTSRRWLLSDGLRCWWHGTEPGDRWMPPHSGGAGWPMHLFTRRELTRLLSAAGFRIDRVQPVGLQPDGTLRWPWFFGRLRAIGYLMACAKP